MKRILPKSLFGRSLLIIVTPLILLQVVSTWIFFDRHWDTITRRLANSIAGDIAWVLEELKPETGEMQRVELFTRARAHKGLEIVLRPNQIIPNRKRRYFGILDAKLAHALNERVRRPFILDENIDGLPTLVRAYSDQAMDIINLKISKVGGLTKAKLIRDTCVSLGIAMTIEDSWGGDIITSAIAHLAHSTPERFRFSATDFNSYVTVQTADGGPIRENGSMVASESPGLGIRPDCDSLGPVIAHYGN